MAHLGFLIFFPINLQVKNYSRSGRFFTMELNKTARIMIGFGFCILIGFVVGFVLVAATDTLGVNILGGIIIAISIVLSVLLVLCYLNNVKGPSVKSNINPLYFPVMYKGKSKNVL